MSTPSGAILREKGESLPAFTRRFLAHNERERIRELEKAAALAKEPTYEEVLRKQREKERMLFGLKRQNLATPKVEDALRGTIEEE